MSDRPRRPRWLDRKPEPQNVIAAYRWLLGRDVESPQTAERMAAASLTIAELRQRVMDSAECRAQFDPMRWRPMPLDIPPLEIESAAEPAQLAALLDRIGRAWSTLGETEPHWSVLTDDRFRGERLADNLASFMASGEGSAKGVAAMLARHGVTPGSHPRLVEFGCGVGRVTLPLAQRFAQVTGCDVSPGHLAAAKDAAARAGVEGIAWWQVRTEALLPPGPWDIWYSHLVLQHNPPPLVRHILRQAFAGLAPGGVALFQVPTYIRGYRFVLAEYLARPAEGGMEMHALPQPEIFALAAEAGLQVLEVRDDSHLTTREAGRFLSHSYLFRRSG
ncbi:methyltransferase type 12 [Falsiroseomonas bella]|uniref:Methyltransferase type 12 n=1 Tax=Falsiroseomonas bella TaxID=2184016 RepID=A0A317FE14_9PROT|nr:class I SAM-dependent methyltransferase [Falsiroseomonas bella]PWS35818.1 methyltransferase type 12 [Falsiroseomonas bella]